MLSAKYITGCVLAIGLLAACSKKETFDVKGDATVKFFVNSGALGNAPQNSVSFAVVNYPQAAGTGLVNLSSNIPATIKIPVFATREVSASVDISATLDNGLIAQYNAANNTNYKAFPEGFLNTANLKATIGQGTSVSADSIVIPADITKLTDLADTAYMAPLKLQSVSNQSVGQISGTAGLQVVYIVVKVEQRKIKYQATTADIMGALATGRAGWDVNLTPAPALSAGSITDGLTSTFARWDISNPQVDVMMPESKNVTGIRIHTSTSSTTSPTQVQVQLSEDGVSYQNIGTPLRANLTYASGYTYILFYKAIPAKYIRLNPLYSTSTNTQNRRVTEFDVYVN